MTRRYDNEGRDQINIENARDVYLAGTRKRADRELKWLKAFGDEVEGRLATSLHNQILINLGKEVQPDQVRRLWDIEVKTAQATEAIAPETEILTVFDRKDIAGKLLILGKPGAGKTTTLLELARALVNRAIDDPISPMPFLLSLSSWKDSKQSIKDWTIAELTTKGIGSKLGAKWITDQKLLPLFDGLDEVRSDLQPACVAAINQFLSEEEQPSAIVVCSRREEYDLYPEKLNLNGAIYLQELSDEQIEAYLGKIDRLALWQVLDADKDLLELVRQPLLLSLTLIAHREERAGRWQALLTTQERLELLLDAYIEQMLHKPINSRMYDAVREPTAKQTCHWLVRLAKQLQSESKTEFLIEKMQTSWLLDKFQRRWYKLIFISIYSLTFGLGFGLIVSIYISWIVGLIAGTIVGLDEEIKTIETLRWSWKRINHRLFPKLIPGIVLGLSAGLSALLLLRMTFAIAEPFNLVDVIYVIACGLIGGLIVGLINVLAGTDIETRTIPNQGIWQSLVDAGLFGLLIGLFPGLICGLLLGLIYEALSGLIYGLIFGLGFVLVAGLGTGGKACIQHFSLRCICYLNGYIPWNYARFLNYATERMFLQRIGGRYRFIHKLLQDHFAQMGE